MPEDITAPEGELLAAAEALSDPAAGEIGGLSEKVDTDLLEAALLVVLVLFSGGGMVTRSKLKQLPGVFPTSATYIGCESGDLLQV